MASYKVPQNVEADDKLLGPFSFRQFIYLIVAVMGIAMGWGLAQLFIPLAVLALPIVLLFGALALPLRKDQPMEVYLAAVVSFYLKPRKRLWLPDGKQSLVEIVAPRVKEVQRMKDISQAEAEQRLSYLADIVDTQGWSVRGVATPQTENSMNTDAYLEAQDAEDILDENTGRAKSIGNMIDQADIKRHEDMMEKMRQGPAEQQQPQQPYQVYVPPPSDPYANLPSVDYDPYPNNIRQSVISPVDGSNSSATVQPTQATTVDQNITMQNPNPETPDPNITTSAKPVSPDIINLANNSDLSIETIAHEAQRINDKNKSEDGEVMITLR